MLFNAFNFSVFNEMELYGTLHPYVYVILPRSLSVCICNDLPSSMPIFQPIYLYGFIFKRQNLLVHTSFFINYIDSFDNIILSTH